MFCVFVFFFNQKTAYEMRISDWSSDVCSSDLPSNGPLHGVRSAGALAKDRHDCEANPEGRLQACQRRRLELHLCAGTGPVVDTSQDNAMSPSKPEMPQGPRITFGMIVLNGEPFLRYNLRSLYPYAHQIIVAEGAAPGARNIATPQGHSRDGTLEVLRRFKQEEDPEDKVVIVTAEDEGHPDGFWPGEKDEQSRAYAKRATGERKSTRLNSSH